LTKPYNFLIIREKFGKYMKILAKGIHMLKMNTQHFISGAATDVEARVCQPPFRTKEKNGTHTMRGRSIQIPGHMKNDSEGPLFKHIQSKPYISRTK
jgi:hypothetical protein